MKLSSHDFLFHRIINMRNTKVKFPLLSITMRKNKKYISDVKNKIVEHHKIESGCKKRVKTLKISTFTCTSFTKTIGGVCICAYFFVFLFCIFNTIIVNIGFLNIGLIIKRFQSTKNVKNLPERGRVSISS